MRINTNITAIVANNALQNAETKLASSIERLSSGYKINRSADDPAGCAISEKMKIQLRGLEQSANNAADGVSVLNTAEGGMTEIQNMLVRMKELAVQAANDVNADDERKAIQDEIDNINLEINRIAEQTEFNTQPLLNGNLRRRVYSDLQGVNQISCSDSFTAGYYGVTVTEDARQAIAVGSAFSMSATDTITEAEAGYIEFNGYKIDIKEGDSMNDVAEKLVNASGVIGGKGFFVDSTSNDTAANGTEYAGYSPSTSIAGKQFVLMTNEYGSHQQITIKSNNADLAAKLGFADAATDEGIIVQGSDVMAEFTMDGTERVGFENSAVISTSGTVITVKDVNNKEFSLDVPGNAAGTQFNDSAKIPVATSSSSKDIVQEVTDVGTMSIHIGANEDQVILIDIPPMTTYALGTDTINVMTGYTASLSISKIDEAIERANEARSKIGAYANRFEHTQANISVATENVNTSISTMIDTDMAEEMTNYTSLNVMTQAATSILSQANERPATVLQLLQ